MSTFLIDVTYSTTFPVTSAGDGMSRFEVPDDGGFRRFRISDPTITGARLTAVMWTEHTFGRHAVADIVTDWADD